MKRKMFRGADKLLFEKAGALRSHQTFAEELLWNYLRTKPFGFKFRRQHPFSNYILDFYCHSLQMAIEVDGSIHEVEAVKENDKERQAQLEAQGLTVLRFSNDAVRVTPEQVILKIEACLKKKIEIRKNPTA